MRHPTLHTSLRQPLAGDHAPHARVHTVGGPLGWRGARSARGLLRSTRAKTTTHTACGLSPRRPLPCLPYSARTAYPLSNSRGTPHTAMRALSAARPRRALGSRALAKPSSTGDNTHHLSTTHTISPSTAPLAKLTVWPGLNRPGLPRYTLPKLSPTAHGHHTQAEHRHARTRCCAPSARPRLAGSREALQHTRQHTPSLSVERSLGQAYRVAWPKQARPT